MSPKPSMTIETVGSYWYFDEDERQYCRTPKTEGPRLSPPGEDWGGPDAGLLEDLKWHPYLKWEIDERASRLLIETDEDIVSAPLTRDLLRQHLADQ